MPRLRQIDREQEGSALIAELDACNRCFGRGAVVPAAGGLASKREWSTKFEMRSPRHTSRRDEMPGAAA
ncbi:DUF4113 domain-containing protein [Methylobacterium sp. E-065]|uniref:DUF4113 domain-containing protein n=1 Tax=Methylobacterium sp. E-065 TaxID=2836583 RepID=UPI001FBAFC17|nr:DUF4113 domain-containing protein [Methylobacterium sp. E-065]MCJ2020043.1 DUF4113 domain-containing protein [Methylobacterium sp. E-065]